MNLYSAHRTANFLHHSVLLCDNHIAVSIAHNPVFHNRTKYMEINAFFFFFFREKVLANQLYIYHVPALDQWVDVLTKRVL